ncbi:MAG: hypothetical protein FJX56_00025 [Alphaproteobacteria bacterium]|nr:hypothetical protein [Alphaproteobacteria bacterium]
MRRALRGLAALGALITLSGCGGLNFDTVLRDDYLGQEWLEPDLRALTPEHDASGHPVMPR